MTDQITHKINSKSKSNKPEQVVDGLPKHWEVKKLGEVCTYSKGKKPAILKESKDNDCSVPYINIKAFEKGIISEYTDGVKCNICNDDDLLMVWDGARCGLIGKAKKGAVGSTLMKILPKENIHKEYLYHFISSKFWTLNTKPKGVGIPHIEPSLLWYFELVVPTLTEQQAIVAKIEELLSELDNGKQQLLTAQKQLKVYRQSLLKWAFEGKLTNTNVKDGELPKGWKKVELKNVVEKISDGPFGSNLKSIDYVDKGVRVIRLENIGEMEFRDEYKTFITAEKYETIKRHTVGKGDIIFSSFISDSIRSAVLPDFIEKAINKADCFLVRADETKMRKKYLAYYFSSKAMQNQLVNQIHGATRPRINTTQLKASLIPFAALNEQDEIVSELESKLTICDKIEETISQSLLRAETLRQSILKQAFEGKLVKP
jgi:type I restriction enzyme, S subunit